MDENEKYVRERVEELSVANFPGGQNGMQPSTRINVMLRDFLYVTFDSWTAARVYIEERERQIAEIEEEIALVSNVQTTTAAFISSIYVAGHIKQDAAKEAPIWKRVLAREQAALAELKRGMK